MEESSLEASVDTGREAVDSRSRHRMFGTKIPMWDFWPYPAPYFTNSETELSDYLPVSSKKTYDSFQDELKIISKQKARGLDPKTCSLKGKRELWWETHVQSKFILGPRPRMCERRYSFEYLLDLPTTIHYFTSGKPSISLVTSSFSLKRTYNSFQDELEDYIKVQKARGLGAKDFFQKDKW